MTKAAKIIFYIVIFISFASLVVAGILIITNAYNMYNQSKTVSDLLHANKNFQATPSYTIVREGFAAGLYYFTLALGFLLLGLLLPRIQNVTISPTGGITLSLIQQNLDAIIKQQNSLQSSSAGEGGLKQTGALLQAEREIVLKRGGEKALVISDPQKGKWGGKAEVGTRKLSATVTESGIPGFFKVEIKVESTSNERPLTGIVKFHLHYTFLNPDPVIAVEKGVAVLKLHKVYGAFTVGAEADDGETRLELDLSEDASYPKEFREK